MIFNGKNVCSFLQTRRNLSDNNIKTRMKIPFPSNMGLMSILLVSMIIISSQFSASFAGGCVDNDGDKYFIRCGASNEDCNDYDPTVYPGHGCPGTPLQEIDALISDVEKLIDSGQLRINSGETNSLLTKLQQASAKVDSGNITSAIGKLNSFINQINAFFNSGKISSGDRDSLIYDTQLIINSLQ